MDKDYEKLLKEVYELKTILDEYKDTISIYKTNIQILDKLIKRAEKLNNDEKTFLSPKDKQRLSKAKDNMDIDICYC